jgi:hypothetical protein
MRWVGAPGAFFLTRRIYLGLKYRRSDVKHYTYRGNQGAKNEEGPNSGDSVFESRRVR